MTGILEINEHDRNSCILKTLSTRIVLDACNARIILKKTRKGWKNPSEHISYQQPSVTRSHNEASERVSSTELVGELALAFVGINPPAWTTKTVKFVFAKDTLQSKSSIRRILFILVHWGNFTLNLLVCGHVERILAQQLHTHATAVENQWLNGEGLWCQGASRESSRFWRWRSGPDVYVCGPLKVV